MSKTGLQAVLTPKDSVLLLIKVTNRRFQTVIRCGEWKHEHHFVALNR